jgi:hypothetical protein
MILHLKDPKNSTKKVSAKLQDTKSIYKNQKSFYTPTMNRLRKSYRKNIPFRIASKQK